MNRPAPISVFSDQYRTKSTTRSRTSCGTHTLVRAPQDFFLKRCARPSIRPAPRPWFGSSFPETRSVVVHLDGPAGSCPGRQLRHSRRTLSANGRTPLAAVHAPHRDQKPALYPTSAASGWQPSPLKCSAFALFACRPLRYLNGRTLSPLPAEARQRVDRHVVSVTQKRNHRDRTRNQVTVRQHLHAGVARVGRASRIYGDRCKFLRLSDGRQSQEQAYDRLAEHGHNPPSLAGLDGCNAEFVPGIPFPTGYGPAC